MYAVFVNTENQKEAQKATKIPEFRSFIWSNPIELKTTSHVLQGGPARRGDGA